MLKVLWKKWCCKYSGKYWYENILGFPVNFYKFIKEICHVLKYGYPYSAIYCMDYYFIEHFSKILEDYKENHWGYPAEFEKYDTDEEPDKGDKEWTKIIQEMITCLKNMDEGRYDNEHDIDWNAPRKELLVWSKNKQDFLNNNKQRFFELFSTYFYNLWD